MQKFETFSRKVENWFELSFFLHISFPPLVLLEISTGSLTTMPDLQKKIRYFTAENPKIKKVFSLRNGFRTKVSSGHVERSFEDNSDFFCHQPENQQLKVRNRREQVFLIWNLFFSIRTLLCNYWSQFWQNSRKKVAKLPDSFRWQSEKKRIWWSLRGAFFPRGSCGHEGFSFDKPL